jgi:signal transduction histidine kinase
MNVQPLEPHQPNVLVVDDTPANLQLLVGMLKEHGVKVRPVPSGELALRAVSASPPDLILLDISMPGMDGFEVIERLRADPASRDIPVLFISALSETTDKVRAFRAGGVDYVTKPFQFEEVMARVRTHLELRRQRTELQHSYERLRELERLREDLTNMIVHDMRSPLLGLQLTLGLLDMMDSEEERSETLMTARLAAAALAEMVNQVLDLSRLETGHLELHREPGDLAELAREAIATVRVLAGGRTLGIDPGPPVPAEVDRDLIRRVLSNLLGNALKFTGEEGRVVVRVMRDGPGILVEVEDDGAGIAEADQGRIFEKFVQADGPHRRRGSGLGLAFARLAVEAHGGSIGVRSRPGHGSTFWFRLPAAPGAGTPA